ncbi:MAG: aminotransferase class IV [Flavisolibacter sp.]
MNFICLDGEFVPEEQAVLRADNRGFKYGDGVFETIKVWKATIPLAPLHFERLFSSLHLLKIRHGLQERDLMETIIRLCQANHCADLARVRLAVYRLEDSRAGFLVEAVPLSSENNQWNEKGLVIDLYPYARKARDVFANLKSANFLPYVMAGIHAGENGLDDCMLLNEDNQVCDTSRANVFLIRKRGILTPALHQGCINGVMRRFLIENCKKLGFQVEQGEVGEEDLLTANEIFLSNAIFGMRWVGSFRDRSYSSEISASIYRDLVSTIYV